MVVNLYKEAMEIHNTCPRHSILLNREVIPKSKDLDDVAIFKTFRFCHYADCPYIYNIVFDTIIYDPRGKK